MLVCVPTLENTDSHPSKSHQQTSRFVLPFVSQSFINNFPISLSKTTKKYTLETGTEEFCNFFKTN